MENGQRVWKVYNTLYVDGEDFIQIGEAFEQDHTVSKALLGNATLRLQFLRPDDSKRPEVERHQNVATFVGITLQRNLPESKSAI